MARSLLDALRQLEQEAHLLKQSTVATLSAEQLASLSHIQRRIVELRQELGLASSELSAGPRSRRQIH